MDFGFSLPPEVDVPHINWQILSDSEKAGWGEITSLLSQLNSYVNKFHSALGLFDWSSNITDAMHKEILVALRTNTTAFRSLGDLRAPADAIFHWPFIAAQDCVLSAYHFLIVCNALPKRLERVPKVASWIDGGALSSAKDMADARFPSFKEMRDAVSHEAEKVDTPKNLKKHAFTEALDTLLIQMPTGSALTISGDLKGRTYNATWKQQILQFDVSAANGAVLIDLRRLFFEAIAPIRERSQEAREKSKGLR